MIAFVFVPPARADTAVIEGWFVGHARAVGSFHNRVDGSTRRFTVETNGHWDGPVLTLAEDIRYWDGEHARKVWHLTKTGATTFVGTREDVVGQARGVVEGQGRLRLRYTARAEGRTLDFDDVLELCADGTMLNTVHVSYLLLPVGEAEIRFRKP
ncbi:DUF3833 family protein [Labrys wisconsinensis]|uniref:DUF3833 domain-containing protein n=1 Tax=Labrys wisconsinensis TaxID=425677 RepID=A0ABU0JDF9_9HYPH|nr:DUF3833 family protein [Labrys wisconsinensis]MDQ0472309.1 hypothetical protein [Labrys wisconsinensis]